MKYSNPVIPGFHPDPSICRVGEDYYLVTSTFEYFPGVPVFYSRDLANWRQIGHCLTRPSQLPLAGVGSSRGIYAPSLRYHDGRFCVITTNVGGGGHFYVHTDDPAGEWSEPVWVEGVGFDPDLLFDYDGRVWFVREDIIDGGIRMWEIDLPTGKLIGPEHYIWGGQEDLFCEAPHIYKIDGMYYLMVAEGGTHRGHMVVVARSNSPTGPYESCPHNPVLTHRGHVKHAIQATGHADLVQAADGNWWLVFLGIRQVWGWHHLGRETFLAPVTWSEDGWPIVHDGQPVELEMDAPLPAEHPWLDPPVRDEFDGERLGLQWNFRRNPNPDDFSLTEQPGRLRLRCSPVALDDAGSPALLCRRQQHFNCRTATRVEFVPAADGEEAGLTAIMNERHHYEIAVGWQDGRRRVFVRRRIGDLAAIVAGEDIPDGPVTLQIDARPQEYTFSYAVGEGEMRELATGATRYLSTEVAGGFTGVYFGMYATAGGEASASAAHFDWFEYESRPSEWPPK